MARSPTSPVETERPRALTHGNALRTRIFPRWSAPGSRSSTSRRSRRPESSRSSRISAWAAARTGWPDRCFFGRRRGDFGNILMGSRMRPFVRLSCFRPHRTGQGKRRVYLTGFPRFLGDQSQTPDGYQMIRRLRELGGALRTSVTARSRSNHVFACRETAGAAAKGYHGHSVASSNADGDS